MREIRGFGVTLRPLGAEDLERLRRDRGAAGPAPGETRPEAFGDAVLEEWSRSLAGAGQHAWLVLWEGAPIGLTRVKNCDLERKIGEGEILLSVGDRDRGGALRVAILGTDWCFDELGLEAITAEVAKADHAAISFNRTLGHVFEEATPDSPVLKSRLTREAYARHRPRLLREITTLEGFGVELRRLRREDLELVRRWRNDPAIRQYMAVREEITEEKQRRWFESIDNEENHYSLVWWAGRPIGLSHVKGCDYVRRTGEGGLFLGEREFRNGSYALRVALVGTDWCFGQLGLETVTGRVLKGNRRAIRFNRALGHVFDPEVVGSEIRACRLTREAYARARPRLVGLLG